MKAIKYMITRCATNILIALGCLTISSPTHSAQKQQTVVKTPFSEEIAEARQKINKPKAQVEDVLATISDVAKAIDEEAHSFPSSSTLEKTAQHLHNLINVLSAIRGNNPTPEQTQRLLSIMASLNKDSEAIAKMWTKANARNMFIELRPLLNVVITKATTPAEVFGEGKDVFDPRYAKPSKQLSQPTIFTSAPDKPVAAGTQVKHAIPKPAISKPTTQVQTPLGTFKGTSTVQEKPAKPTTAPTAGVGSAIPRPPTAQVTITPELLAEYNIKTKQNFTADQLENYLSGVGMNPSELRTYLNMKPEEQETYIALNIDERKKFLDASPKEKRDAVKKKFEANLGESLTDKQLSDYLALSPEERAKYAITLRRESAERAKATMAAQPSKPSESKATLIRKGLTSNFTSAFSKENLFKFNDKEQRAFLNTELPTWKLTIKEVSDYITQHAGGDSKLKEALNSCVNVNNLIVKILTNFYSPERNYADIQKLIGKPSDTSAIQSLMGQRTRITEKPKNPEDAAQRKQEQVFPKLKQLKFGFFTPDKAKTEARDVIERLGTHLLSLIDKIEKEFNALPKAP